MAQARELEPRLFSIPTSYQVVSVSIVDTTTHFKEWSLAPFVEPQVGGCTRFSAPSYSFKITHPTKGTVLFDLGVRKDWHGLNKLPPPSQEVIRRNKWTFSVDKDVAQILSEQGGSLDSVRAIIWSHFHWDHTGDPSTFPRSTKLVVGPGFKDAFLPGFPVDPNGKVMASAFEGQQVEEINFDQKDSVEIAGFRAFDYFEDGSFYILDAPGHTIGHICGLARTTLDPEPSFIFMGGDIAHQVGQFRPSPHNPLPKNIAPDPQLPLNQSKGSSRSCDAYVELHPAKSMSKPFYRCQPGMAHDVMVANESLQKLQALDGDPRVFVIIAHDNSLQNIIDFFPQEANAWRAKGWKDLSLWRFLGDFKPEQATHV